MDRLSSALTIISAFAALFTFGAFKLSRRADDLSDDFTRDLANAETPSPIFEGD